MYIDQDKQAIFEEIRATLAGIQADLAHMKVACDRRINYLSPRASMAPVVMDVHPDVHKVPVISHSEGEQWSTGHGNDLVEESVPDVVSVTANVTWDFASTEISSMKVLKARIQSPTMAECVGAKIHPDWAKIHPAAFSNGVSPNYLGSLVKDKSPGLSMQRITGKSIEYFLICLVVALFQPTYIMHHVPANPLCYLANKLVCGWLEKSPYYVIYIWSFDPGIGPILLCAFKDSLLAGKIQEMLAPVAENVSLMSSMTTDVTHGIEFVDAYHLLLLDDNTSFLVNHQFNNPLAFKGGTCSTISSVCTSYRDREKVDTGLFFESLVRMYTLVLCEHEFWYVIRYVFSAAKFYVQ